MLFVHSFSPIEQSLFNRLSLCKNITQLNCLNIKSVDSFNSSNKQLISKTLLYSFQKLDHYKHLASFQQECQAVDLLIDYMVQYGFTKIILLTYPGAYFNSTNLFLQHKGLIEQKMMNSGIPCTMLNVQAIHDSNEVHNLHSLFYDYTEKKYMIPQKSRCIVYSIKLESLISVILKSVDNSFIAKYDVFDTIFDLKTFLIDHSSVDKIQRVAPLYLYFKSYLGIYASPTMLELFLMTIVPMYKFRTEKEFAISLEQEPKGIYYSYNRQPLTFSEPYNVYAAKIAYSDEVTIW